MMIRQTAWAKINLALHVRARRPDGYHDLDSVFVFLEAGDHLRFEPADDLTLAIDGPRAAGLSAGEDNLVLRAARALAAEFGVANPTARITLTKSLPAASGIGGGSADAAAAIRGLTELWDLPDDYDRHLRIAATLGSDVPACVASRPLHVEGRGDTFDLILDDPAWRARPTLLVNPGVPLGTAPVFARWDGIDRGPIDAPRDFERVLMTGRNDLTAAAIALVPAIAQVLAALAATNPLAARMSGSGATCFAVYPDEAARDQAAAHIAATNPDWWHLAGALR